MEGQKEKRGSGEEGDREEGRGRMGEEEEKGKKNREEPEHQSDLESSLTHALSLALTSRAYLPFLFTEAPSLTSDGPSLPLSP